MTKNSPDFPWWHQPLEQLSATQWEQLCDGCGKCCLHKLQDEDTHEVMFTAIACDFLDLEQIRCTCYSKRQFRNPDCMVINPSNIAQLANFLPQTCAYRRRFNQQALPDWHPLICETQGSVEKAGQSVKHRVVKESQVAADADWQELILVEMI